MILDIDPWEGEAACKDKPVSIFFPLPKGGSYHHGARTRVGTPDDPYGRARQICAACPVRQQCLDYSLAVVRAGFQLDGMFGGRDEHERRDILRRARARVAS